MKYQPRETALQRQIDAMMAQAQHHIPTQSEIDQREQRIIVACDVTEQKIRDGKMFWADYICEFGTANECLDANRKLQPRATSNPVALRKIDASIKFWQDFIAQSGAEWKKAAK